MEDNISFLLRKQQWDLQMDKDTKTTETVEVEEKVVEQRDIRKNLLEARKKQLLRRKRGYGKLPSSLRR